ncbi:hypothetical protein [Vibrio mediterranei]|uniref:hypothetical protein n=1 Tax=Vibrio mediterranei TaxID=689 RepID=UPI0040678B58
MEKFLVIGDVKFDVPNVRQTAIHLMKYDACDERLSQVQVEEHLKECALEMIRNGEHGKDKLLNASGTKAHFIVEDFKDAIFSTNSPYRYEVCFFVRLGRRQEL